MALGFAFVPLRMVISFKNETATQRTRTEDFEYIQNKIKKKKTNEDFEEEECRDEEDVGKMIVVIFNKG